MTRQVTAAFSLVIMTNLCVVAGLVTRHVVEEEAADAAVLLAARDVKVPGRVVDDSVAITTATSSFD
jgi:hypothetical protein